MMKRLSASASEKKIEFSNLNYRFNHSSIMKPTIHLVVGARPNYIKANPVFQRLDELDKFDLVLVNTGQHYDHNMAAIFIDELGMKAPDINLGVGAGTHGAQTAKILAAYEKVLIEHSPDLVVVFGDVNSPIACSLAATKLQVPVAHVEAGLRSFDWSMPEEVNRVLTDRLSTLLFTTSPEAERNLNKEGIASAGIHFVGNTMIDSLVQCQRHFAKSTIQNDLGLVGNYALMTFHRPSNVDDGASLHQLVTAIIAVAERLPCIFPVHPRTKNKLEDIGLLESLQNYDKIFLIDPIGYIDFMHLQQHAAIVLTDSGGIQEESTFFGVPCLTVRENTERPITTTQGTNKLIGIDYERIPQEVDLVLATNSKEHTVPDLWDGKAANRISAIIDDYFNNSL
mgnify:CR=1 FL=1